MWFSSGITIFHHALMITDNNLYDVLGISFYAIKKITSSLSPTKRSSIKRQEVGQKVFKVVITLTYLE